MNIIVVTQKLKRINKNVNPSFKAQSTIPKLKFWQLINHKNESPKSKFMIRNQF